MQPIRIEDTFKTKSLRLDSGVLLAVYGNIYSTSILCVSSTYFHGNTIKLKTKKPQQRGKWILLDREHVKYDLI